MGGIIVSGRLLRWEVLPEHREALLGGEVAHLLDHLQCLAVFHFHRLDMSQSLDLMM